MKFEKVCEKKKKISSLDKSKIHMRGKRYGLLNYVSKSQLLKNLKS